MEKEVPEVIRIDNPYVIKEDSPVNQVHYKVENEIEGDTEEAHLVYKSPRLFRKSLIFKTWKLFHGQEEPEAKTQSRPLKENVWWVTIMLVGFLLAFSITDRAWQKFQNNPTFTSLLLTQNEIKITYPSVTVCPRSAEDVNKIFELIKKSGIKKNESQEIAELLKAIPNFSYGSRGLKSVVLTESATSAIDQLSISDLRTLAFHLAMPCKNVFASCHFKNKSLNCCDEFKPIYSEHGFCYSFNSRFYGTSRDDIPNTKLNSVDEFDDLNLSAELKVPAKVYINPSDEVLHFEQMPAATTGLQKFVDVTVSMQQTKTNKNIEELSVPQRKCILKNELKLKHFSNEPYTFSNCMKDCRIDQALNICGCLPPFYRLNQFNNITHCDIQSLKCLKDEKVLDIRKCSHCELSCEFTIFSVESIHTLLIPDASANLSQLRIRFEHWPLLTYHREVRFGLVDFLVAFGSILALFLSFSILSAIEILLYILRFVASKFCPKPAETH